MDNLSKENVGKTPIIELKNATVSFGDEAILQDINLEVFSGETVVLIGPSGGGKTILLKTLAGLYHPQKGVALCFGKKWKDMGIIEKHKFSENIGMQFQTSALFDDLDSSENVAFPLREHNFFETEEEVQARVLECLKAVSLEKALHLKPYEMSGGMKVRLGIARAIALKPQILLLDDPTAGLDPLKSDEMTEMINGLKNQLGTTLVVVTHDILRAYQFAGRIIFVGQKQILETGSARQTIESKDERIQQFIHGRQQGPLTNIETEVEF